MSADQLLLDTHVLVWMLSEPTRIGPAGRVAVQTSPGLHASALSHVELQMKAMAGKLTLPERLSSRLDERGVRPLPFTAEHAEALPRFLELVGHDPFDRMLLAQALVERLRFLTADRRLLALGLDWVVDART